MLGVATASTMFRRQLQITAWLLVATVSVAVAPARSEDGPDRIEVSAEESIEVSRGGDTIEARGDVRIRRRESVFGADSVEIGRSERTLRADGSVFVHDPRYRLRASSLDMDLTDETGTMLDAEVFIEEGHLTVGGGRVEKSVGQVYRVEDGYLTTCRCPEGAPPWRIGAREVRLGEDGKAMVEDVTLYVYDVPVLYLPHAYFPHVADRTTGLLVPSLGWSDQAGVLYRQPFFWALDKSNDVTLNLAVESKTRWGFTGQYRTVLNARTEGRLDLSYFDERLRGLTSLSDTRRADRTIPRDRWSLLLSHRHRVPPGWSGFSDVALYSDSFVTRELMEFTDLSAGERRMARASRYSASRMGLHWHGSGMTLEGQVDYVQDLVQPQARALHRVPHLAFSGFRGLGRHLDLGWDVELTRYVRREFADGLRVDIRPELTWPVTLGRYFRLATSVALRETLYRLDSVEGRFDAAANDYSDRFDRTSSRELLEVRSTLATSLSRGYGSAAAPWGRLRHVLEPAAEFLFIPATDQRRLPLWDEIDRINRRNLLTLSLTNRFWRRRSGGATVAGQGSAIDRSGGGEAAGAEQFARARVAASFDIDRARRREAGRLSEMGIGLGLNPSDKLDVAIDMSIDPGPWSFRHAALGFTLSGRAVPDPKVGDRDFRRPNSFSLSYRHIRENPLAPLANHANLDLFKDCPGDPRCAGRGPLDGVQANALLHLTDRLLFLYDGNYDGASGRLTGNQVGLKYLSRCRCWTLALFLDRQVNPDRTLLSFKFNLLGLGS